MKKNSLNPIFSNNSNNVSNFRLAKNSASICEPVEYLNAISRKYPEAWKMIEGIRSLAQSYVPSWCFASVATCKEITDFYHEHTEIDVTMGDSEALAALAAWRYTQGIYEFEESVYETLTQSEFKSQLPAEIIQKLPEWCVYIKTPHIGLVHGFFAHLDYDHLKGTTQLFLLLDTGDGLHQLGLSLGNWDIKEGLTKYFQNLDAVYQLGNNQWACEELINSALPIAEYCLMLVLYLCCCKF